jgi:cysteine desulfurase family protein (TIGR01976 family)
MSTTVLDVEAVRARYSALQRRLAFFDGPGGTQCPDEVIDAIAAYMRESNANVGAPYETSIRTDALVETAHDRAAAFLGCSSAETIFGPSMTTLGFALTRALARTLREGDEVVVTRLDHDANVRPWILAARDAGANIRWVDVRDEDVTIDQDSFDAQLTDRTKLVAFTLASNAVGTIPPAADMIRRAKAVGALVALDGVHFAQHRAIDLRGLGADIVATSPYKFFGPHQGMLGVRRELLTSWQPYKLRPVPDEIPDRWETGTQNHEALAGTVAAIRYVADAGGFNAFAAHERMLSSRFLDGVARIPAVRLVGIADPERVDERTPTFAVRVGTQHPLDTSAALGDRGIFTWEGHYYAIEVFDRLGLLETGGAVRIGFCHYHTPDEVDRVLEALDDLSR